MHKSECGFLLWTYDGAKWGLPSPGCHRVQMFGSPSANIQTKWWIIHVVWWPPHLFLSLATYRASRWKAYEPSMEWLPTLLIGRESHGISLSLLCVWPLKISQIKSSIIYEGEWWGWDVFIWHSYLERLSFFFFFLIKKCYRVICPCWHYTGEQGC